MSEIAAVFEMLSPQNLLILLQFLIIWRLFSFLGALIHRQTDVLDRLGPALRSLRGRSRDEQERD